MNKTKILFAGDFVITDEFKNNNLIDESVMQLFEEADYRIVNLEAPITPDDPSNKIIKTGPHLRSSVDTTAPYLKQLKINAVTLANNHILDYGEVGLEDTLEFCKENGIQTVGAGKDFAKSTKPLRKEIDGKIFSFINFAENEWASAMCNTGGAHPMDIIDNANLVKFEKEEVDIVIVIIHGGHEYYHYPSPRMKKQYRFYAEMGADIIIGHHTHCIGGYEVYKETPIFYSLGNFLFTKHSDFDNWYKGLVVKIEISKTHEISFDLIPSKQRKEDFYLETQTGIEKKMTFIDVDNINKTILVDSLLREKWDEFIKERNNLYIMSISPLNRYKYKLIKAIIYKSGIYKKIFNIEYTKRLLNAIRCESHKDAICNILYNQIK